MSTTHVCGNQSRQCRKDKTPSAQYRGCSSLPAVQNKIKTSSPSEGDFLWFQSLFVFLLLWKWAHLFEVAKSYSYRFKPAAQEKKQLLQSTWFADDCLCRTQFLQYFCTSVTPCILMSYFKLGCCCLEGVIIRKNGPGNTACLFGSWLKFQSCLHLVNGAI